jgi:hypothetical protein
MLLIMSKSTGALYGFAVGIPFSANGAGAILFGVNG